MPDKIMITTSSRDLRYSFDTNLVGLAVVSLCAAAAVWFLPFILDTFTVNVLTRSLIYAILAVTVDILWGFTGVLTFGQAAFFGTGAYAAAMVLTHLGATPELMVLALVLAIVIPMVLGLIIGWLSFYPGSTALYASVISLVVPIVVTQVVFSGGVWTGSSSGLVGYETLPLDTGGYFQLAGLCLVAIAAGAWMFVRSDAGKVLVAIRDNEARCAYLGLNTRRVKVLLTMAMAGIAGLAGFLYANAPRGGTRKCWVCIRHGNGHLGALGGRGTVWGRSSALSRSTTSVRVYRTLAFPVAIDFRFSVRCCDYRAAGGLAAVVKKLWNVLRPDRDSRRPPARVSLAPKGRSVLDKERGLSTDELLSVQHLAKAYGNLTVLQDINLAISRC